MAIDGVGGGQPRIIKPPKDEVVKSIKEGVAETREVLGEVNASSKVAGAAADTVAKSQFEGVTKAVGATKDVLGAVGKASVVAGVVTNAASLVTKASNVKDAIETGDVPKIAATSAVAAGGAVDVAKGVMTFMGKQVNPALKIASLGADAVSAMNTYLDPNATTAHKVSAGLAVVAGAVALVPGPVGWIAGLVETCANAYSANETQKELAGQKPAAKTAATPAAEMELLPGP
jgi:hypothetical protein